MNNLNISLSLATEALEPELLSFMRTLRNKNSVYFTHSQQVSIKDHERWWKEWQKKEYADFYIIFFDIIPIGTISVTLTNNFSWEVGNVLIAEEYREKGILREVMEYIKKTYGSNLFLRVLGSNKNAIEAYIKLGFKIRSLTMEL